MNASLPAQLQTFRRGSSMSIAGKVPVFTYSKESRQDDLTALKVANALLIRRQNAGGMLGERAARKHLSESGVDAATVAAIMDRAAWRKQDGL